MIVRVTMESDARVPDDPGRPMRAETWTIDHNEYEGTYTVLHPTEGVLRDDLKSFRDALNYVHDEVGAKYGADRAKWNA